MFDSLCEILPSDPFSVWEVRHGSIMALREILTYQGASAGILMPGARCPGVSVSNLEDKDSELTMKRERDIDLNLQVSLDDPEPVSKRPKFEEASSPRSNPGDACEGADATSAHANGITDASAVKVESQSDINCSSRDDATVTKDYSNDKESLESSNTLKNIPRNSELMNFVEGARTSWLRNCEFLQDCALRFLCVLSLDRYVLFL